MWGSSLKDSRIRGLDRPCCLTLPLVFVIFYLSFVFVFVFDAACAAPRDSTRDERVACVPIGLIRANLSGHRHALKTCISQPTN